VCNFPAAESWDETDLAACVIGGVRENAHRLGVFWRSHPATPGSSGDWVEVVDIGAGRLAICVGDAAGHGEQAARFARRFREAMRRHLLAGEEPEATMHRTMNDIAGPGDIGEMFATAFLAVVDARSGQVVYVNAGHPPALHLPGSAAGGGSCAREPRSLGPTGPILSDLFAGSEIWSSRSLTMDVGDRLLLYTDGISEARDAHGTQFGTESLSAGRIGTDSPDTLLDRLFAQLAIHAHGVDGDDRTMAILARDPLVAPAAGYSPRCRAAERTLAADGASRSSIEKQPGRERRGPSCSRYEFTGSAVRAC
jgi:serine phosphatase RsbU (regulator of sigma subunit)